MNIPSEIYNSCSDIQKAIIDVLGDRIIRSSGTLAELAGLDDSKDLGRAVDPLRKACIITWDELSPNQRHKVRRNYRRLPPSEWKPVRKHSGGISSVYSRLDALETAMASLLKELQ